MRPFTAIISLEEARRRLAAAIHPIARTERLDLDEVSGRVAALDVASTMDVPPFSRSAMDGYAVVAADTATAGPHTPVRLRQIDRIYTGHMPRSVVTSGTCAEIATGAPLPDGADAVVMVEETTTIDHDISIMVAAAPGQNIGRRGADITTGAIVVRNGSVLTPSRIGALAAIGRTSVEVYARPRAAILSTGNEIVPPGQTIGPGQIFDVNRFTLATVVRAHGGIAEPRPSVPDTVEALTAAIDACRDADLIVFSGGSSVGERDLILDLVAARGEMIFHGVAIKPGKPTAFALIDRVPFFGMPGNPTSCLSNAYILLVPFLRAMARLPPWTPRRVQVPLARRIVSAAGRHQFYTVRLINGAATPAFKGSGDVTSLSEADGYIEIPEDQSTVDEGAIVDVTLF